MNDPASPREDSYFLIYPIVFLPTLSAAVHSVTGDARSLALLRQSWPAQLDPASHPPGAPGSAAPRLTRPPADAMVGVFGSDDEAPRC